MPSANDTVERLTREIAKRARIEPADLQPGAHFMRDLGMSSLDLLSVLAYAEQTYSVRFPDELIGELTSLDKVLEAIDAHEGGAETVERTGPK